MRKFLITLLSVLIVTTLGVPTFAVEYLIDFLEPGNPGGFLTGLKTFEDEYTVTVGDEIEADIYMTAPEGLFSGGFLMYYIPTQVSIVDVEVYDGTNGPSGPWDPVLTSIVPEPDGPGIHIVLVGNLSCVTPDTDGDIILTKVRFRSESSSDASITFQWPYPDLIGTPCGPNPVGCEETCYEGFPPNQTVTLHPCYQNDIDCDSIPDGEDNCPGHSNPFQEDTYPPQGNNIGDPCDCEGNFDCDEDVDGTDAAGFKVDFGRSNFLDPCTNEDQCNGDFDCDNDCDGTDAALFKSDFGQSTFNNPCPNCSVGIWCKYVLCDEVDDCEEGECCGYASYLELDSSNPFYCTPKTNDAVCFFCNSGSDCAYSVINSCCCSTCTTIGFQSSLCMPPIGCDIGCESTCLP